MGADKFVQFITAMQTSNNYLCMGSLIDGHSYKIFARNAYVGIWNEDENAFLISRYKVGSNPHLFYEYHWDLDDQYGTVKPLEFIEECPFEILDDDSVQNDEYTSNTLNYLNRLEDSNPIITDYDSRQMRKLSACNFALRLSGAKQKHKISVHKLSPIPKINSSN